MNEANQQPPPAPGPVTPAPPPQQASPPANPRPPDARRSHKRDPLLSLVRRIRRARSQSPRATNSPTPPKTPFPSVPDEQAQELTGGKPQNGDEWSPGLNRARVEAVLLRALRAPQVDSATISAANAAIKLLHLDEHAAPEPDPATLLEYLRGDPTAPRSALAQRLRAAADALSPQ